MYIMTPALKTSRRLLLRNIFRYTFSNKAVSGRGQRNKSRFQYNIKINREFLSFDDSPIIYNLSTQLNVTKPN